MKPVFLALLATATVLPSAAAIAEELSPPPYFVANCFNCHGTEGRAKSVIPTLAGKDRAIFIELMKGFKDGSQRSTIMQQLAKGYTDEEIAVLADYFSQLQP